MTDMDEPDVERALALHQQGKLGEAEPIYDRVLAADPDNADVLSLRGTLYFQSGRHEAAVVGTVPALRNVPCCIDRCDGCRTGLRRSPGRRLDPIR